MPTEEQTAIRTKAGIEFAFPHLYTALKDLFELIDAFTGKNKLIDEEKKVETAYFASRRNNHSDEKHSKGNIVNHREKDWINKALDRDKHVRKCFVCSSEDHLARNCPKNPNLKKLKFEKWQRKKKKWENIAQEEESNNNYMSNDSLASSNNSESHVSRKVIKNDFWSKKNKAENPFGGGRQKVRRNHHISYLQEEIKCPSEVVEEDGCSNSPVWKDETQQQFRDFDAIDGDASQITLKSIGGHVLQMTAVALMGAIYTIFYAPTAWCTSISKEWIVNHLDLTIISASEENGGIRFMKGNLRIMTGFWYEGRKCIRKSQLIELVFWGEMCITEFVYEAAERGIFPIKQSWLR